MAPLKLRKPSAILFDIIGTATKSYFIDQILFPYIRQNCKVYLENNWDNSILQNDITLLREQAKKDQFKIPGSNESDDAIQNAVVEYVNRSLELDNEALTQFKFHMLFDGYAKNRIETPLYTDVAIAIRHWAIDDHIQLFVFSNGWCEATKRYLQKTNHGDMNLLISGHFDTKLGPLTDPATYKKLISKVKHPAEDILFLTHSGAEGRAAKKSGLSVVLIMTHRRDINKLSPDEKKEMPYVRSFNELIFTGTAPKAYQLDGSSVQDDDEKSDGGKSLTSGYSKTKKSKSKPVSSSTGTKSSPGASKTSKSSTTGSGIPPSTKSSNERGKSKSKGVPSSSDTAVTTASNEFSGSSQAKSKKQSSAAASKSSKSKTSSIIKSNIVASKASISKEGSKVTSSATGSKVGSTASATGSKAGSNVSATGSKAGSNASATGSKAVLIAPAPGSKAGSNASATGSKAGSIASATGSKSGSNASVTGSKAGSNASATGSKVSSSTSGTESKASSSTGSSKSKSKNSSKISSKSASGGGGLKKLSASGSKVNNSKKSTSSSAGASASSSTSGTKN